jgi:hypothetical protein
MESKTLKLSFADLPNFAALHESESGPFRRTPRCSDMSAIGGEADLADGCVKRR